jgi:S1-C subfamily serine protease
MILGGLVRNFVLKVIRILTFSLLGLIALGAFYWNDLGPYFVSGEVRQNLPKFGKPNNSAPKFDGIIQLRHGIEGFCSAFVIDGNYAVTAAHCIRKGLHLDKAEINIFNHVGQPTGVTARPVGLSNRVDLGLIQGNFSDFQPMTIDVVSFTPMNNPGIYFTCGFPQLQNQVTCIRFIPVQNENFYLAGQGMVIPGMSGGPVVDVKNKVVMGVNSAVSGPFVMITPIIGLFGLFGIDP